MRRTVSWALIAPLVALVGCLSWALWPVLVAMAECWSSDPRYAHGYLVPMFSLALLWMRRDQILSASLRPSNWGVVLVAVGAAIQLLGGYFRQGSIEGFSLLPYCAGVALMLGGWPALRWSLPSIMFLFFMIALPWRIEKAASVRRSSRWPPWQAPARSRPWASLRFPRAT